MSVIVALREHFGDLVAAVNAVRLGVRLSHRLLDPLVTLGPQTLLAHADCRGRRLEGVSLLGNQADRVALELIGKPPGVCRSRRWLRDR